MTITPHKQHNHNSTAFLLLCYFYFYSFTGFFFLFAYSWTFYVQLLFLMSWINLTWAWCCRHLWVTVMLRSMWQSELNVFIEENWEMFLCLSFLGNKSCSVLKPSRDCWLVKIPLRLCRHCSDRQSGEERGGGAGARAGSDPGLENWQHIKEELIVGAAALWPLLHLLLSLPPPNAHTDTVFLYFFPSLSCNSRNICAVEYWRVLRVHREAEGYMVLWQNFNTPLLPDLFMFLYSFVFHFQPVATPYPHGSSRPVVFQP